MPDSFEQAVFELSVQGIFFFGPDFRVADRHSAECVRIFGGPIAGMDAPALLFKDKSAAADFRKGVELAFGGGARPDVVFDLLESEIELSGRRLHLDYRLLDGPRLMVSLTDLTRERRFQEISKRELERRFIVIKAVSHRRYFAAFTQEAAELFDTLSLFEGGSQSAEELQSIGRSVHTFKGNASFFDFAQTAAAAHEFESHLEETSAFGAAAKIKDHSLALKKAYFAELNHISDLLGQRWISEANGINIPKRDYLLLEAWVRKHYPKDLRLYHSLIKYRREPFRESFARLPELAAGLADKLGKRLHPMLVEGGDYLVIPDRYRQFADTMVHLIRNAVDHGVETPAEREAAGKDSYGTIRVQLEQDGGRNVVRVSDDGRGIDPAQVEQKAKRLGLLAPGHSFSEAQLMQFLFHHGFSTAAGLGEVSGRGVGLGAVKAEIDRIGGTIQIHSRLGRGTTFEISLPNGRKGKQEP